MATSHRRVARGGVGERGRGRAPRPAPPPAHRPDPPPLASCEVARRHDVTAVAPSSPRLRENRGAAVILNRRTAIVFARTAAPPSSPREPVCVLDDDWPVSVIRLAIHGCGVGNWFGKSKRMGLIMGIWNAHTSVGKHIWLSDCSCNAEVWTVLVHCSARYRWRVFVRLRCGMLSTLFDVGGGGGGILAGHISNRLDAQALTAASFTFTAIPALFFYRI
ncbi:hypothetical protein ABZP36_020945 [Zizania latifolia]